MSKPPSYSHVVEVTGPGRTVYLAGQPAATPTAEVAEGIRARTTQVLENIKTALAFAGGGFEHVVKITSYLVDLERDGVTFRGARLSISQTRRRCRRLTLLPGVAARQPGLSGRDRRGRGAAAEA